jgi:hypothetical protein
MLKSKAFRPLLSHINAAVIKTTSSAYLYSHPLSPLHHKHPHQYCPTRAQTNLIMPNPSTTAPSDKTYWPEGSEESRASTVVLGERTMEGEDGNPAFKTRFSARRWLKNESTGNEFVNFVSVGAEIESVRTGELLSSCPSLPRPVTVKLQTAGADPIDFRKAVLPTYRKFVISYYDNIPAIGKEVGDALKEEAQEGSR